MGAKCENCRYWSKSRKGVAEDAVSECRYNPPTLLTRFQSTAGYSGPLKGFWPRVSPDCWCGQFKDKK